MTPSSPASGCDAVFRGLRIACTIRLVVTILMVFALTNGAAALAQSRPASQPAQQRHEGRSLRDAEAPNGQRDQAQADEEVPGSEEKAAREAVRSRSEAAAIEWPDLGLWKYRPSRFNLSGRGGLGLMLAVSPYTLETGEIATGISGLNYDRYPGDIDVVDVPLQFAIGLPGHTEAFFRFSPILRTNSVGQDPLGYPIPPLDLFVDTYPTSALRPEPYFMIAQEFPYKTYAYPAVWIDPPGNGAFASSSGDLVFGFKANVMSEERADGVGLGFRAYVAIPTETPEYNSYRWRHLAGDSGEIDFGFDVLAAKKIGRAELLLNGGYEKIGDPDRGIIIQYVNSSATSAEEFLVGEPIAMKLDLRDRVHLLAGIAIHAFDIGIVPVWFMGEYGGTFYVGGGTPVERKVHPQEMRLGLQCNLPFASSVSLGFAWQLTFNDAGDGTTRTSNFATADGARGDINFSELVDPELSQEVQEYLGSLGAEFSPNSSKVFATDNPAFDHWRNITTEPQTVIGQGGGAFIFFATWHIGSLW